MKIFFGRKKNKHFFWHEVGHSAHFALLSHITGGLRLEHNVHSLYFDYCEHICFKKLAVIALVNCKKHSPKTICQVFSMASRCFQNLQRHRVLHLDYPHNQSQILKQKRSRTCDYLRSSAVFCWSYPKLVLLSSNCSTALWVWEIWQLWVSVWLPETSRRCQIFCNELLLDESLVMVVPVQE